MITSLPFFKIILNGLFRPHPPGHDAEGASSCSMCVLEEVYKAEKRYLISPRCLNLINPSFFPDSSLSLYFCLIVRIGLF
jgi:hypothetical protein